MPQLDPSPERPEPPPLTVEAGAGGPRRQPVRKQRERTDIISTFVLTLAAGLLSLVVLSEMGSFASVATIVALAVAISSYTIQPRIAGLRRPWKQIWHGVAACFGGHLGIVIAFSLAAAIGPTAFSSDEVWKAAGFGALILTYGWWLTFPVAVAASFVGHHLQERAAEHRRVKQAGAVIEPA